MALPIAFTSFGYQGMIPTLVDYLGYEPKKIRASILIGSLIPLAAYIVWEWLILGIIPLEGDQGISATLQQGKSAVEPLKYFLQYHSIYVVAQYFAFFALVTSFLGVTLGLLDFLADGFHLRKTCKGKLFLCLLIFIPPIVLAFTRPGLFLEALNIAGGIGCALLLGGLPILMVLSLRYRLKVKSSYQFKGGLVALTLMLLFVLFEVGCEIWHLIMGG